MVRDMHSDDPQQLELLRVCRIGRAQGLKGEVTVQIFTDEPEYRFAPGAVLYTKDGEEEYVVESSRTFKNRWIIKFEGIDDRDASEAANGVVLYGAGRAVTFRGTGPASLPAWGGRRLP